MTLRLCIYLVCMMHILHTATLRPSNTGVRIADLVTCYGKQSLVYGCCGVSIARGIPEAYCRLFKQTELPPVQSHSHGIMAYIHVLGTCYSARHIIRRYINNDALTQLYTQTSTVIDKKIGSHSAASLIRGVIGCIAWQGVLRPLITKIVDPTCHRGGYRVGTFTDFALSGPCFDFIGAVCMPNHYTAWIASNAIIRTACYALINQACNLPKN